MKTGRNDPCPCGSGKKYKKCCLQKDQEANARRPLIPTSSHRDLPAAPPRPARPVAPPHISRPKPPPEPPDPAMEKINARWREFEAQDPAGRVAVYRKALDEPELMEDEIAFEMLSCLHTDALQSGERSRFDEYVAALRERLPEVYKASAHFYLSMSLQGALADGRMEAVRPLALELATHAGPHIDTVHRSLEALAYHGQLSVLVEAMRVAWPGVKATRDILPWALSEFGEEGAAYEIYDYIEHTPSPTVDDSALLERIRFYFDEPDLDFLRGFMDDLTGQNARVWKVNDFSLRSPRPKKRRDDWDDEEEENEQPDPGANNLFRLIAEFIGYLHRHEGVPYPRGQLARGELARYFLQRHNSELDPRPSMMESALHPDRKLPKPPPPIHPLCPERVTFEVCLAQMVGTFNNLFHKAAALFEIVPAWLRFLESRGLIDEQTRTKVVADLLPLQAAIQRLWGTFRDDPALTRAAQHWPEDAAKGLAEATGRP
jgi:hypothetical protein